MAEWASGYVVDIDYTHGFYQELTPSLLCFLTLLQGIQPPALDREGLSYCELGCGQGFSTNLLAAVNPHIQFHATDFNPSHVVGARTLAQSAGLRNVHFLDDSFAEFLNRGDLPDFDFITLHGIYSWISPENRQAIVRFIAKRLKPGGIVYISYNCMPGWASMMPLRRLLAEHAEAQGSSRSLPSRVKASLEFAERLSGLDTRYFANHPKLATQIKGLKDKSPNYIAHEYFNRELTPFYFMDVAQELSEAKLTWVGSANVADTIDALHLTKEQQQLLAEIDSIALRQTVRDHIIDQQFRRDIFVKGPLQLGKKPAQEKWLDTRFFLSSKGSDIPRKLQGLRNQIILKPEIYDPLIAALEQGPRTLRDVMSEPALATMDVSRLIQAITFLAAQGVCHPCLPERGDPERKLYAGRFNKAVVEHARHDRKYTHLASGVTGGGIKADQISQLFWLASHEKEQDAARFAWSALSQAGMRLMKDGKGLKTEEENLAEIRQRLSQFQESSLSVWQSAGLGLGPSDSERPAQKQQRA